MVALASMDGACRMYLTLETWRPLLQGPVWLPELHKLFFVSNRLGNQETTDQRTELWTLDPETLARQEIVPSQPILMANGATNWAPSKVLVEQQVSEDQFAAAWTSLCPLLHFGDDRPPACFSLRNWLMQCQLTPCDEPERAWQRLPPPGSVLVVRNTLRTASLPPSLPACQAN